MSKTPGILEMSITFNSIMLNFCLGQNVILPTETVKSSQNFLCQMQTYIKFVRIFPYLQLFYLQALKGKISKILLKGQGRRYFFCFRLTCTVKKLILEFTNSKTELKANKVLQIYPKFWFSSYKQRNSIIFFQFFFPPQIQYHV